MSRCDSLPVSQYNAAIMAFIAANAPSTTLTTSWTATTANGGNSDAGMPVNQVAGTQALETITLGSAAAQSDAGPAPFFAAMAIETWPDQWLRNQGTVGVTNGSPNIVGSGTTWVSNRNLTVGGEYCFGTSGTLWTIQSITDDTHATLTANYTGTTASGLDQTGPFNLPPTLTQATAIASDNHALVLVRDESTGSGKQLWEGYGSAELYSPDTADSTTWHVGGLAFWDLEAGTQRFDGYTSTAAGGFPVMPFLVRWDEVSNGVINHPLRGVLGLDLLTTNQSVWPGLHAAGGFGTAGESIPYGGRLRLNAAWYAANISSFSATNQVILTALKEYGMWVTDGTSPNFAIQIDGVNDDNWVKLDVENFNSVPYTAFEVVDTIAPQVYFSGPVSGVSGTTLTYLVQYMHSLENINFQDTIYLQISTDGGSTWSNAPGSPNVTMSSPNNGFSSAIQSLAWTPSSAGSYQVKIQSSGGPYWIFPGPISVTVTSSNRTVTSTQDGDWANAATWGSQTPPGNGDYAVINNNVTISDTGSTVIGDGTSATVLSVAPSGVGSLTINGAVLTIRGASSFGNSATTSEANTVLALNSVATQGQGDFVPAGLVLDANSGVAPVVSVGKECVVAITGTSAAHCFIQTRSGTAGNAGYLASTSSVASLWISASYCDFSRLGDASNDGIASLHCNDTGFLSNPPFTMDHCAIDSCGVFPDISIVGSTVNFQLTNCAWTNTVTGTAINALTFASAVAATTGTRVLENCTFGAGCRPYLNPAMGLSVSNSYFGDLFGAYSAHPPTALFDGCFVTQATDDLSLIFYPGALTNCYVYLPTNAWTVGLLNCYENATTAHNVYEYAGTSFPAGLGSGGDELGVSPGSMTYTWEYNLFFSSGSGEWLFALLHSSPDVALPNIASADWNHNTIVTSGKACIGGGKMQPDTVKIRGNIFYNATAGAGAYAYEDNLQVPVTDAAPAATVLTNCIHNCSATPVGEFTSGGANPVSGATNCTDGTPYFAPMSGATVPGAGDLAATDPQFFDATRNLAKWSTFAGGSGTAADAMTRIQANIGLVKSSLLPYVQAGYRPTNTALATAAYDGTTIGAVAFQIVPNYVLVSFASDLLALQT